MKKRGQAALEFLTTYGWAVLIVLVMIGALAYFGVMRPKTLLPDKCMFTAGIDCKDQLIQLGTAGNDIFSIKVTNNLGKTITVDSTSFTVTSDGGIDAECTNPNPGSWPHGKTIPLDFTSCDFQKTTIGFAKGEKERLLVEFKYNAVGGYDHTLSGEIFSTVE